MSESIFSIYFTNIAYYVLTHRINDSKYSIWRKLIGYDDQWCDIIGCRVGTRRSHTSQMMISSKVGQILNIKSGTEIPNDFALILNIQNLFGLLLLDICGGQRLVAQAVISLLRGARGKSILCVVLSVFTNFLSSLSSIHQWANPSTSHYIEFSTGTSLWYWCTDMFTNISQ